MSPNVCLHLCCGIGSWASSARSHSAAGFASVGAANMHLRPSGVGPLKSFPPPPPPPNHHCSNLGQTTAKSNPAFMDRAIAVMNIVGLLHLHVTWVGAARETIWQRCLLPIVMSKMDMYQIRLGCFDSSPKVKMQRGTTVWCPKCRASGRIVHGGQAVCCLLALAKPLYFWDSRHPCVHQLHERRPSSVQYVRCALSKIRCFYVPW